MKSSFMYEPKNYGERIQVARFMTGHQLDEVGNRTVNEEIRRYLVDEFLHALVEKYISQTAQQTADKSDFIHQFRLDVRVLTPADHDKLIYEAFEEGMKVASRHSAQIFRDYR